MKQNIFVVCPRQTNVFSEQRDACQLFMCGFFKFSVHQAREKVSVQVQVMAYLETSSSIMHFIYSWYTLEDLHSASQHPQHIWMSKEEVCKVLCTQEPFVCLDSPNCQKRKLAILSQIWSYYVSCRFELEKYRWSNNNPLSQPRCKGQGWAVWTSLLGFFVIKCYEAYLSTGSCIILNPEFETGRASICYFDLRNLNMFVQVVLWPRDLMYCWLGVCPK